MFGTMCKPLHAGKAAYHGLMAAKLAARGFTSRTDVVECGQGFAGTHSPDFNPDRAFATPPEGWWIVNTLFKYHASCYMTHAAIEAARTLREQHDPATDQIRSVRVRIAESSERICNIPAPCTGLEAKFSLRLTTAMGLAGVDTGCLSNYSSKVATDPVLVGLRDKVELDFRTGIPSTFSEVELRLTDRSRHTARHESGIPAVHARQMADIGRLDTLADVRGLLETVPE